MAPVLKILLQSPCHSLTNPHFNWMFLLASFPPVLYLQNLDFEAESGRILAQWHWYYFQEVWQITSDSNTLIFKHLICELICLFSEQQALIWVFDLPWEVIWIEIQDELIWNSNQMQITGLTEFDKLHLSVTNHHHDWHTGIAVDYGKTI